ncbi:MAG: hypothetical protein N2115_03320 [bacterium]|nr:hypothetical protein [bacterium]
MKYRQWKRLLLVKKWREKMWIFSMLTVLLLSGCAFAQSGSIYTVENAFQEIYSKFSKSGISDTGIQDNQVIDELKKLSQREDVSSVVRAKSYILLCLSYIFQNNLSSAYNEILKAIPVMEKSTVQGQDTTVFSRMKASIEKNIVKDYQGLIKMPEFSGNARQIVGKINFLIEGRENFEKSVEQCKQKYKPILKAAIESLIKENKLEGSEAENLRKQLEQKYLSKIEKDGYFLICDLKQDFWQYLFEKLFSD